jgi:hypothetical protein
MLVFLWAISFFSKCHNWYPRVAQLAKNCSISGLYYKPMMIINDNSRVINKLKTSLTDDARVVIYNFHIFIEQPLVTP